METTLAYIAGLFDGEGTCGLAIYGKDYSYNPSYQANVNITNTSYDLLESVKLDINLGKIDFSRGEESNKNWKKAYKLWFPQEQVPIFLKLIQPFVRLKDLQINLVLEYYSIVKAYCKLSGIKDPDVAYKEHLIYKNLLELNKRGL